MSMQQIEYSDMTATRPEIGSMVEELSADVATHSIVALATMAVNRFGQIKIQLSPGMSADTFAALCEVALSGRRNA